MNKGSILCMLGLVCGFVVLLVIGLTGISEAVASDDTSARPIVPDIQTYGFPPGTLEGQPAECDGDPDCGTMCFLINEGGSWYWEISCVPWVFPLGLGGSESIPAGSVKGQ